MSSREVHLTDPVQKGDTLAFEFNWLDDSTPPVPKDMRDKEFIFTMKLSPFIPDEEASVLISVTTASDDTQAENGKVIIVVPRSMSQNLIAGTTFHYGLRVIEPGFPEPNESTHVYGTIPVKDA